MAIVSRSESTRPPILPIALAAAAAIWHGRDLSRHWDDLVGDSAPGAEAVLALRVGAACLQLALLLVAAALFARARSGATHTSWQRLRGCAIYVPAAALVAATLTRSALAAGPEAELPRAVFFAILLLGSGVLAALPGRALPKRASRWELFAFNAIATCALLELALAVVARVSPSPLLFSPALEARLAAVRPEPGSPWFGGRLNAGGYHDEPFFTASESDLVVAVIADSFGIGVVPYAENFVTKAEARLRGVFGQRYDRVAIHNFGVPAIGLEEYAHLLEAEVAATNPALVALCIFVGNDITSDTAFGAPGPGRFTLQEWLVVELPRRLLARQRAPEYVAGLALAGEDAPRTMEPPAFAPEAYLALEARRLDVTNPKGRHVARRYDRFFTGLSWFRAQLGDRLLLLVFPDEFQVDDELWEKVLARQRTPAEHVRDLPQQRISAWATRHGVELVDTTAALRAAHRTAPVYAPRNTHLNVKGNEVAGSLLATALTKMSTRGARR